MKKLRRMNAPWIILNVAEKAYRLWKLNKLDVNLQALLRDLEGLAERVKAGEIKTAEVEIAIRGHAAWLAMLERTLANHDAAINQNRADITKLRALSTVAKTIAERARRQMEKLPRSPRKRYRTCRKYHARRNGKCVDVRLYPARAHSETRIAAAVSSKPTNRAERRLLLLLARLCLSTIALADLAAAPGQRPARALFANSYSPMEIYPRLDPKKPLGLVAGLLVKFLLDSFGRPAHEPSPFGQAADMLPRHCRLCQKGRVEVI